MMPGMVGPTVEIYMAEALQQSASLPFVQNGGGYIDVKKME